MATNLLLILGEIVEVHPGGNFLNLKFFETGSALLQATDHICNYYFIHYLFPWLLKLIKKKSYQGASWGSSACRRGDSFRGTRWRMRGGTPPATSCSQHSPPSKPRKIKFRYHGNYFHFIILTIFYAAHFLLNSLKVKIILTISFRYLC